MIKMKGRILALISILIMVISSFGAFGLNPVDTDKKIYATQDFVPGEIVIGFNNEVNVAKLKIGGVEPVHGALIKQIIEPLNVIVIEVDKGKEDDAINSYLGSPLVKYAEKNMLIHLTEKPNDPGWENQWGPQDIHCPKAWDNGVGSTEVTLAIVDTGVDYHHEDLSARYIGGRDIVNNDNDPMDDNGHGTHCAGIAAGTINNEKGIAGIAQVSIMAVKVLNSIGSGSYSDVADGIVYAADNGADVISLSLGGPTSAGVLEDACNYAWQNGAVIVAAAGNDGTTNKLYPAAYDNVIAVAANDKKDERAWFSNYGDWVDVSAPGVNIFSTYPHDNSRPDGKYKYLSGTSMACPHVAGVAALAKSWNPSWSNKQIRQKIFDTADKIGDFVKYGKVDATLDDYQPERPVEVKVDIKEIKKLDEIEPPGAGAPEWFYEVTVTSSTTQSVKNFNLNPGYEDPMGGNLIKYFISEWQSTDTWYAGETHSFGVEKGTTFVNVKIKLMEEDYLLHDLADISNRSNGETGDITGDETGRIWKCTYDLLTNEIVSGDRSDPVDSVYRKTRGDWDGSDESNPEGPFDWKQDDAELIFSISDTYDPPTADAGGPYTGIKNILVEFHGDVTDGLKPYTWLWDFGDGSSSNEQNPVHAYSEPGTYTVTLTVTDEFGISSEDTTTVTISENQIPNTPTIEGPPRGSAGESITYHFKGTDPNKEDKLSYFISWGDGTTTGWTEYVPQGTEISKSHKWDQMKLYQIKVKTKDLSGEESEWAILPVRIPRTTLNPILEYILEKLPVIREIFTHFFQY